MRIEYWSGTGNSFLISREVLDISKLSHLSEEIDSEEEFVRQICNGRWGLVSDGFLTVRPVDQSQSDFVWNFFNRDGSRGEMCGNAARCVVNFLEQSGMSSTSEVTVETLAGTVWGQVLGPNEAEVSMPLLKKLEPAVSGRFAVDSGVPHILIEHDVGDDFQLSSEDLQLAEKLRWDREVAPNGSNVTFYRKIAENHIRACTFERGVENVTLACGTGAVAAAWTFRQFAENFESVRVDMPGGPLRVRRTGDRVYLAGPTRRHFVIDL